VWLKNYVREYSSSVHTIGGRGLLLDTYVVAWDPDPNSPHTLSHFPMRSKKGNDSVRYLHYTIQGNTRQDKIRHSKHGTATFVFVVIDCRHGISFRNFVPISLGENNIPPLLATVLVRQYMVGKDILQHSNTFAGNVMVWDFNFQSLDDDEDNGSGDDSRCPTRNDPK